MRTTILTILILLGFCGPPASASQVTYHSTQGNGSGYVIDPYLGYQYFNDVPASLRIAYTYDPAIPGVVSGGTTTFSLTSLTIFAGVGSYFNATVGEPDQPGTIRWSGDTIAFHVVEPTPGFPSLPTFVIDVSFKGSALVPGVLPDSLAGLEAVVGTFHAVANPTVGGYRGDTADVIGTVVSAPEPSSAVLLVMGAVGMILASSRRSRRGFRQPVPAGPCLPLSR